jgi:hypothetical protein
MNVNQKQTQKRRRMIMVRLNGSFLQKMIIGLAGLLLLLLVTGCTGVSGVGSHVIGGTGTPTSGAPVQGSISFTGPVQSVSSTNIVVQLPSGQSLTASIVTGQTDLSDLNGALPSQGQTVQITATANTDGTFTATEIKAADSGDTTDQNTVTFEGVVTGAVGSDQVIHFRVGTQDFSFTLSAATDLSDFQNNAQAIGQNQAIEVKVQFQGTTATVIEVSLQNDQNDQSDSQNG